jgi:hypothetical protein
MSKHVSTLKNHIEYYKGSKNVLSEFIKEFLKDDNINEKLRKHFIDKVVELKEMILMLYIFYHENLIWKEK